ncbi:nitrite reductase small subunit NirD [Pseudonocardia petroleophila]|uniref:Nitrite reductase small subunit NirD n=1 Tax=Pseudonocardia petroleophila TaxID=37331 RepID=A0A7G7MJU7_9PSEU|nr:nitrite reductase small subunit NirD [Pseudonocardia petroleophila]QNG53058.1 nitrite reductase small subunit NirD [Pseudonocardia petroleophila]
MTATETSVRWTTICPLERLLPERGVAALVGDVQVALFRLHDGSVHAVGNVDPFSGAAVMSRGIVGDRGGVPTVASPVYKQAFSLVDGRCLDDADVSLPSYPVRVEDGQLDVGLPW